LATFSDGFEYFSIAEANSAPKAIFSLGVFATQYRSAIRYQEKAASGPSSSRASDAQTAPAMAASSALFDRSCD
jgi:hypothetical protein